MDVGSWKLEAGSWKPEAGSRKPEAETRMAGRGRWWGVDGGGAWGGGCRRPGHRLSLSVAARTMDAGTWNAERDGRAG
ncbi:hypothetical protein DDJ31_21660 [Streptomyces griseoviridis]|uniref:Uncharacterized protein n=1 Tax=Streptomyces griseoviridis TaxID=45398 RepID=A0ABX5TX41_STRGD|nr:hypothetical protein DDJ31_21660 [Streptomyces griseoviridis]